MKMNRFSKKLTVLLLSALLLVAFSVNAFAALPDNTGIMPLWDNISDIVVNLAFDGNEGNATGTTRKTSTATSIEATLYVYEWSNGEWVYIDETWGSKSIGTLRLSIDFPCESGVEYKAVMEVTAYNGSVGESFTAEYSEVC